MSGGECSENFMENTQYTSSTFLNAAKGGLDIVWGECVVTWRCTLYIIRFQEFGRDCATLLFSGQGSGFHVPSVQSFGIIFNHY